MIKYLILIVTALSIDAFQALLALVLSGIAFVLGLSVVWIPFIGAPAAGAIDLGGLVIGIAIDFVVSATFGSGLIALLMFMGVLTWNDLFSVRYMPFAVAKFIPFIDALPFYTAMTVMCILKKESAERAGVLGSTLRFATAGANPLNMAAGAASALSSGPAARMRQMALSEYQSRSQQDESAGRQRAEGIRPVLNDIRPQAPATSRPNASEERLRPRPAL
jgi:hypothetical protein